MPPTFLPPAPKVPCSPIIYREYRLNPDFPIFLMPPNPATSVRGHLHFHNCLEFAYCPEGEKKWDAEGQTFRSDRGDVILIPPFCTHNSSQAAGSASSTHYIYFDPTALLQPFYPLGMPGQLLRFQSLSKPFRVSTIRHPQLQQLTNRLVLELASPGTNTALTVRGLMQAILVLLSRFLPASFSREANGSPSMLKVLPALEYINQFYAEDIRIGQLAGLCYMQTEYFRKEFYRALRQSPSDYLKAVRVQKACELLRQTELSVTDISLQTGFHSISVFYKAFSDYLQTTPCQWRNEQRLYQKKHLSHWPYVPDGYWQPSVQTAGSVAQKAPHKLAPAKSTANGE